MANDTNSALLGLNFSSASSALRKQIIFHLAGALNLLSCYQCGQPIETHETLSIEHKEPWRRAEDPKVSFFDMNNIAFSHLSCNVKAAIRQKSPVSFEDRRRETNKRYQASHPEEVSRSKRYTPRRREYMRDYMRRQRQSGVVQR